MAQMLASAVVEPDVNPFIAWKVGRHLRDEVLGNLSGIEMWADACDLTDALRRVIGDDAQRSLRVHHHDAPEADATKVAQWFRARMALAPNEVMRVDAAVVGEELVLGCRVNHLVADAVDACDVFGSVGDVLMARPPRLTMYAPMVPVCDTGHYNDPAAEDDVRAALPDSGALEGVRGAGRLGSVSTVEVVVQRGDVRFDEVLHACSAAFADVCGDVQVWRYPFVHPEHRGLRGYHSQLKMIGVQAHEPIEDIRARRAALENAGWFTEQPAETCAQEVAAAGYLRLVLTETRFYEYLCPEFDDLRTTSPRSIDDVRVQMQRDGSSCRLRLQHKNRLMDTAKAEAVAQRVSAALHDA
jgi:hypothetical protein